MGRVGVGLGYPTRSDPRVLTRPVNSPGCSGHTRVGCIKRIYLSKLTFGREDTNTYSGRCPGISSVYTLLLHTL